MQSGSRETRNSIGRSARCVSSGLVAKKAAKRAVDRPIHKDLLRGAGWGRGGERTVPQSGARETRKDTHLGF